MTSLKDGGFVIAWEDNSGSDNVDQGSGPDIYGQRYDDGGQAVGSEFLINSTYPNGTQTNVSIAAHGDGFVASWTDHDGSANSRGGSGQDVFA